MTARYQTPTWRGVRPRAIHQARIPFVHAPRSRWLSGPGASDEEPADESAFECRKIASRVECKEV